MFARVSTLSVPPERMEEARRQIVEQAAPAAKGLPGRMKTFWLSDDVSGTVVTVSIYETEADLAHNREAASAIRRGSARSVGGSVATVREFEIFAEA
jgi:heme-degrading monooxygenase HmoA